MVSSKGGLLIPLVRVLFSGSYDMNSECCISINCEEVIANINAEKANDTFCVRPEIW